MTTTLRPYTCPTERFRRSVAGPVHFGKHAQTSYLVGEKDSRAAQLFVGLQNAVGIFSYPNVQAVALVWDQVLEFVVLEQRVHREEAAEDGKPAGPGTVDEPRDECASAAVDAIGRNHTVGSDPGAADDDSRLIAVLEKFGDALAKVEFDADGEGVFVHQDLGVTPVDVEVRESAILERQLLAKGYMIALVDKVAGAELTIDATHLGRCITPSGQNSSRVRGQVDHVSCSRQQWSH